MITHSYKLDMCPGGVPLAINLSQYDSDVQLVFELFASRGSFVIESGTTVAIRGTKPDGNGIDLDAAISDNVVTVSVTQQMTAVAGTSRYELTLYKGEKELNTANFRLIIERAALDKDTLISGSEIRELVDIIDRTDEIIQAATDIQQTAEDLQEYVDAKEAEISQITTDAEETAQEALDEVTNVKNDLNNTSQVVYKTEISSLVGLIPFHAKNGDSITIKTKDGSNFAGNDQLRFYDANGTMLAYLSTAPTTVNSRTFTYNNGTEALYIGLTKVASSVIDYVVVNNSSPYLTEITDRDTILQNQINLIDSISSVSNLTELFVYEQPSISVSSGLLPFPVKTNDSITIERIDGQLFQNNVQIRFYDENKNFINYYSTIPADATVRTITWSYTDASYVGVTDVGSVAGVYKITNNNSKSLLFAEVNERKVSDTFISNRVDILDSQAAKAKVINRFNKATVTTGKYININNGTLTSNDGFFASDFIYIGDLDSVTVSYTHLFCWYDENKGHLTPNPDPMNSRSQDLTFTRPQNAMYLRFSAYNSNLDSAQIGESVTRNNYVPFGVYNLPELRVSQSQIDTSGDSQIVVDASGGGDYTSFTQAIYETVDSGIDVYVKPGTYDIVAEYVTLFGQSAVDSMADADSAIFNGFQYGVRLRNRKVEFAPGAHLVCDWTGHTVDGTHRFSALGVDYNVEIIGLDLDVTSTFYCIHDDYGVATPYTVKYENCRVVGHNLTNANCIGGGCKKYSRHILNNCYFDNNLTGSATVRYHNTNAEGAEPEIYVSNCYFNNWFTPRWYGPQTSKMRVYVNNCHARAIYKVAESSSYDVDNVELYKWNNEETDPRT